MDATRNVLVRQTIVGEPERRDGERSEVARSGGSPTIVRETSASPDPEVTARHARRRFTTPYKLEILRKADACTRSGQLGAPAKRGSLLLAARDVAPPTRGRTAAEEAGPEGEAGGSVTGRVDQ